MNSTTRIVQIAAAGLMLVGMTGCIGRIRGPAVPKTISTPVYDAKNVDLYNKETVPATKKALRDQLVYGLMADIEYLYRDYASNLFINNARFSVAADFFELGLSTAATLGNGARTKSILSALGTGVAGEHISIDKNYFRQRTIESIINAMEARRSAVEKRIIQQLQKGVDVYPYESALKDLREYFFAGTLEGGLTEIQQQTAAAAKTNLKRVEVTKENLVAATQLNRELGTAASTKNYAKLIKFLQTMGKPVDDKTPPEKLQEIYHDLSDAALDDPDLMKKFMDEAKKAGLIN